MGQGRRTEYKNEIPCAIRYEEKGHGERPLTPQSATRKSMGVRTRRLVLIKRGLCRKRSMERIIEGVKRVWPNAKCIGPSEGVTAPEEPDDQMASIS